MISGSTDDVRRGPRGGQPAVDPLLRYLSYSGPRLMHNLLRAFNNANHLSPIRATRPPRPGEGPGESIFRGTFSRTLIFHQCFDVCFVSIRPKGESVTRPALLPPGVATPVRGSMLRRSLKVG